MTGLLTAWRRLNPPTPDDWSWVKDFLEEPETQRLLQGAEVDDGNPEVGARALCIKALKMFRRAHQAGDNEQAWRYLEHAERTYRSLPEFRIGLKLALWEFWRGWLLMRGPSKRQLSERPVFNELARLGDMDADQVLFEIKSMEQSRRRSVTPPLPRRISLKLRGFVCVVKEAPSIRANDVIDMVEAGRGATPRIYDYDEDDIRLYLDDNDSLVIEDLKTGEKTQPIPTNQICTYLKRALKRQQLTG